MSARELIRAGDVAGALDALQAEVRADPSASKHRVFLFQLLAVTGQWERALTQLNVAADLDGKAIGMATMYREALAAEALRAEVFAGRRAPLIFGEPPQWIALLLQALQVEAQGETGQASELRARAFEDAPVSAGTLDGGAFEWLADGDSRLGPVLEMIVNGQYYWAPMARIRSIVFEPPEDLRDLVWLPATFTWANGGEAVGLVPTRYAGTDSSTDADLLLARKTEWLEIDAENYRGLGQRVLTTDADEKGLLEVQQIELATAGADSTDSAAAD